MEVQQWLHKYLSFAAKGLTHYSKTVWWLHRLNLMLTLCFVAGGQALTSNQAKEAGGCTVEPEANRDTHNSLGLGVFQTKHLLNTEKEEIVTRPGSLTSRLARPSTAPENKKHASLRMGCINKDASQRPRSAGVGVRRHGSTMTSLRGFGCSGKSGVPRLLISQKLGCSEKLNTQKKELIKGKRRRGGGGNASATKFCDRDDWHCLKAAWSYESSQREHCAPPRHIFVKVPHVKVDQKGKVGNTSYRIAWSGEVKSDGCGADVGRSKHGKNLKKNDKQIQQVAHVEAAETEGNGTTIASTTTCLPNWLKIAAVVPPYCPPEGKEEEVSSANIDSSVWSIISGSLSPPAVVEKKPHTSRVIAQLRASVARERQRSTGGYAAVSTASFSRPLPADETPAGCSIPDIPVPDQHRDGAAKPSQSMTISINRVSFDPSNVVANPSKRGQKEAIESERGTFVSYDTARARNTITTSINLDNQRPKSAEIVGNRRQSDVRAQTEYSFFPSSPVSVECRKNAANTQVTPGGVCEWENSWCSSAEDRGGFDFELEPPGN